MSIARHVYEIYIKAAPEAVWQAITDPEYTSKYFYGTRLETAGGKGDGYRYVGADASPAIEGVIEEIEPTRRLVMNFRFVYDAALAEEPPSRVEWVLTAVGDLTRVTLRHGDLFKSPRTWERVRMGWVGIIDGLKTLLETGVTMGEINDPESAAPSEDPEGEWHRDQGIAANNGTWDSLGKPDAQRTPDDEEAMTRSAYAAAYHWARAARSGPENSARAEWLLSRVWTVRINGALGLHHADRCMAVCDDAKLADFDLAYAYEARARALACLGRREEALAERALAAAVPIAGEEDRRIVEVDLDTEPWFGI